MTIQEGPGKSSDPLSSNTKEWTVEDMMKNLQVDENPPTATLTATNDTTMASRLDEEQDGDCPILKKVPIDLLPRRFQTLLKETIDPRMSVEFIPTRIPKHNLQFLVCINLFVIVIIIFQWLAIDHSDDDQPWRNYVPNAIVIVVSVMTTVYYAFKLKKMRAPLYAQDGHGARKPWPGDWKTGVYMIGTSALLDFDGTHAWLLPVNSIMEFENDLNHSRLTQRNVYSLYYNRPYPGSFPIKLKVRSPPGEDEETFKHVIFGFEEESKRKEVEDWYKRCTESSA